MIDYRQGDVLDQLAQLKSEGVKVRTCVTSPPYWGLRDYGASGQIGLEKTPDEYVAKMVQVFRAVRDVLADDGTLWLNLGDSYATRLEGDGWGNYEWKTGGKVAPKEGTLSSVKRTRADLNGLKPKDLVGIPWRVAFALQADGWYLRSDIIWHKPNPMPESVRDRPTKAHEYIFLLSKSPKYFYDADAVREPLSEATIADKRNGTGRHTHKNTKYNEGEHPDLPSWYRGKTFVNPETGRNRRSVWTVTTKPYKGAHFAVFPGDLIEPCILAGTSAKGQCPQCGAAWERVTEREKPETQPYSDVRETPQGTHKAIGQKYNDWLSAHPKQTIGWQPTCDCGVDPVPDLVLDPFGGSGTTAEVALKHGRRAILIELNPQYVELQRARLAKYETAQTAPLFEV